MAELWEPWRPSGYLVKDRDGEVIAECWGINQPAKALLIAAAPRMADYIRLHAERDPEARAILQEAGVL